MKSKLCKRLVSGVLSLAVALSSMPMTRVLAAADQPISHNEGYILANVGGVEPFTKLDFTIGGEAATGEDLTYIPEDTTALSITEDGICALKEGAHKLTVANGSEETELYVFVKDVEDTDYTVIDANFTTMTALPSDWTLYQRIDNNGNPVDGSTTSATFTADGLQLGLNACPRVGLPAFLEQFSDYTIEAGHTGSQPEIMFRLQDVDGLGNPGYVAGYITGDWGQNVVSLYAPATLCDGTGNYSVEDNRVRHDSNRSTSNKIDPSAYYDLRVEVAGTEVKMYANEELKVTGDLNHYYDATGLAQTQFNGNQFKYENGGIALRNTGIYKYVKVILPASELTAAKAPEAPSVTPPKTVVYDFVGANEASDWVVTNTGESNLQVTKADNTLTFATEIGWPKANLDTAATRLFAEDLENTYLSYDFTVESTGRVDLWSEGRLLVLSDVYATAVNGEIPAGTYEGEISLVDLIASATIYPQSGNDFGEPLTDNSVVTKFEVDGALVWAVGGDVTINKLALVGEDLETAPEIFDTQDLYDALYPTNLWSNISDSGYDVVAENNTVKITNKRIDYSNNVGWPGTGTTVDWDVDVTKTPYLYLDVLTDGDLEVNPSARPNWNLTLVAGAKSVNMDKVFNAGYTADVKGSRTVKLDLTANEFAALRDGNMIHFTGIELTAVTDRYRTVEFKEVYISNEPKDGDTKTYAAPEKYGEGNLNYRMPLTTVKETELADYRVDFADGANLTGDVTFRYDSKDGTDLSVKLDGATLTGTDIAKTPDFYMESNGISIGTFKGPGVRVGSADATPAQFTKSTSAWGNETISLADAITSGESVEIYLCAGNPSGNFQLGTTTFGAANHNDPDYKNVKMTLPSGEVVTPTTITKYVFNSTNTVTDYTATPSAYDAATAYKVGDGWPAGVAGMAPVHSFTFDLTSCDLTPVVLSQAYTMDTRDYADGTHTLELLDNGVVQDTITFTVDNSAERLAAMPTVDDTDDTFSDSTVEAGVTATSPADKDLTVSFYEATPLAVTATAMGTDFTPDQISGLTQGTDVTNDTQDTTVPDHTFAVTVGDYTGDVALSWSGETKNSETIRFSVKNPTTGNWDALATANGNLSTTPVVDAGTYADNGVITAKVEPVYVGNGSNTMLWVTDTQHYTYFEAMTHFYTDIADYAVEEFADGNMAYMAHTGDIVEADLQSNWDVAVAAHDIIDGANIPNGLSAGNHDVGNHSNDYGFLTGSYDNFTKHFGAHRYNTNDWWGGSDNDNINHFDLITLGDYDFIMLYLGQGYEASMETAQWVTDTLAQYPDRNAVVLTHEYLKFNGDYYVDNYGAGGMTIGQDIYDNIVEPNKQILLVLCGHESGAVTNIKTVGNRQVIEMLADYQTIDLSHTQKSTDNYNESNGDGFVRLLSFADSKLDFTTYSPSLDAYNAYHSSIDTGSINMDLKTANRTLTTNHFSAVKLDDLTAVETKTVSSGAEATATISLTAGNGWFASISDGEFTIYTALTTGETVSTEHLQIQQVYGASDDGRVSHSFIELYNPTDEDINLDGMSLQYRSSADGDHNSAWEVLKLTGTIAADDYFVIRAGEIDDIPDYYLTSYNQSWDGLQIHNKGISVALVDGTAALTVAGALSTQALSDAKIMDLAAAAGNDYEEGSYEDEIAQLPYAYESADGSAWGDVDGIQSKKKAVYRTVDTDNNNADFIDIDYSEAVEAQYLPHADISTTPPPAPAISNYPAIALETVSGFENGTAGGLDVDRISGFNMGDTNKDGGMIEIVTYNTEAQVAYAVAGAIGELVVMDMSDLTLSGIPGTGYNMEALLAEANMGDFVYGDMSSVAINKDNTKLAVALQAEGYNDDGKVAIFTVNADGSLGENPVFVDCGKQPDALTFTPDGTKILVANEGEPREGYDGVIDPEGSVTIIDMATMDATKVSFDGVSYDKNVLLKNGSTPAADFEPEYIATTNTTAYVALQENNAIAVLDLASKTFTGVCGLGLQDFSQVAVDMIADGEIKLENQNVYGIRMPDGISLATIGGVDYLFTANEGDGREWGDYENEQKGETSPTGNVTLPEKATWFNPADYDMLDQTKAYLFGARSFSIFKVSDTGLELVFDSGSDFEEITAELIPDHFNCSNDDISLEDRSGKKGCEPEYALTGEVDGKIYAFIGLERMGGIMVYDVTNPAEAKYVNYINTRDYSTDIAGDVAPEGMTFIPADQSPTGEALLLAANEVSGTMPVYELTTVKASTGGTAHKPSTPTTKPEVKIDFIDVDDSDWFAAAVDYVVEHKLFQGVTETMFAPNANMTREMTWVVLGRLAGEEFDNSTVYADARDWAMEHDITDGTNPTDDVTREQLVTLLWRFAGSDEGTFDMKNYQDADQISAYALPAIQWALENGVISGVTTTTLDPQGNAIRAHVAQIMMNYSK